MRFTSRDTRSQSLPGNALSRGFASPSAETRRSLGEVWSQAEPGIKEISS